MILATGLQAANGEHVEARLVEVSPFLSSYGPSTATTDADLRVDFCGLIEVAGKRLFGLRDHTTKRFLGWVSLHETTHDFTIMAYDSTTESITLQSHGVISCVALQVATVIHGQAAPTSAPVMELNNGKGAGDGVAAGNPLAKLTPEERRAHIQQVVDRERALARARAKADAEAASMVASAAKRQE